MRAFIAIDGSAHGETVVQAAASILRRVVNPGVTLATIIDATEAKATGVRGGGVEIPRGVGLIGAGGLFVPQTPGVRTAEDRTQAFARLRSEVTQHLSRLADEHLAGHSVEIDVEVAEEAEDAIRRAAERCGADVIVLGTHGRTGLRRMVLGSVAQSVVHQSAIPAILVRQPMRVDPQASGPLKVLLPIDGSSRVLRALPRVGALASALGATVTVVRVMELPSLVVQSTIAAQRRDIEREIEEHVAALAAAGIDAEGKILEGYPARAIVNFARETDSELVIVPTHDRSEAGRVVFGSVADHLIHDLPCPIALVRTREP